MSSKKSITMSIEVYNQIKTLTSKLIEIGLCTNESFPSIRQKDGNISEVSINTECDPIYLKNITYSEMYAALDKEKYYNIKTIDGALILMQYRFENNDIINHRLSFLPSPKLELFDNFPEIYEQDEIYADILAKNIVSVPLRFDFDKKSSKKIIHPVSHLTIGQYKNCRIPVFSALYPYQFISFIVCNFYNAFYNKNLEYFTKYKQSFVNTILEEEKKLIHINLEK